MGTLYAHGISSGDIGGAIAEAVLHDIRVNGLGLQGFPEIHVTGRPESFAIDLRFAGQSRSFEISRVEARQAVEAMKARRGHMVAIFERVQDALAQLEGAAMSARAALA